MKSAPKIITALFLLQLIGLALLFVLPTASNADTKIEFTPQITVDEFKKDTSYAVPASTEMIAKYIRAIYKYTIGIVGILATVVMMVGGIIWLTAGGNQTRIGEAKSWIGASLTGLVIALASYLILATVNPALVNFKITKVEDVKEMGCCDETTSDGKCGAVTQSQCKGGWKGSGYSCNTATGKCDTSNLTCAGNTSGGQCKTSCDTSTEASWSKYKCDSGKICCLPKNYGTIIWCELVSGVDTICRDASLLCKTYGEESYLANCKNGHCCKKGNYVYCGNDYEGLCFECPIIAGVHDCVTAYCSGGWERVWGGTDCSTNFYCCKPSS